MLKLESSACRVGKVSAMEETKKRGKCQPCLPRNPSPADIAEFVKSQPSPQFVGIQARRHLGASKFVGGFLPIPYALADSAMLCTFTARRSKACCTQEKLPPSATMRAAISTRISLEQAMPWAVRFEGPQRRVLIANVSHTLPFYPMLGICDRRARMRSTLHSYQQIVSSFAG